MNISDPRAYIASLSDADRIAFDKLLEPEIRQVTIGDPTWRIDNLYWIQDEHGKEVQFVRNEAQLAWWRERWLFTVTLKARQLGFSTLIAMEMLDECLFNNNFAAGIIDYSLDDAKKKLAKIRFAFERIPAHVWRKIPPIKLTTDNKETLEFSNGSRIEVGTSHRGGTLQHLHVCLDGDTGIYTSGGVKPIREVASGDLVLTSKASYSPVISVIKNRQADLGVGLLEVVTFGCPNALKITENHSVLAREHKTGKSIWKPAGKLSPGDYIGVPIREPSNNLRDGTVPFGERRIRADETLGWLCGFYLAEGTTRKKRGNPPTEVSFSVHADEVEGVLSEIGKIDLSGDEIRDESRRVRVYAHASLTRVVTVNSRSLAGFLHHHFGAGDDKRIPDKVWKWGSAFLHAMVRGYIDGDGSYVDRQVVSVVSTRRQLIDQLRLLCVSLRYGLPAIYYSPAGVRYGRNCKEIWTLKLGGAGNWKFREKHELPLPEINTRSGKWRLSKGRRPEGRKLWRRGAEVYWARVIAVREIDPVEFVYDIALDGEPHNYLTVNGIVHNSEYGRISTVRPDKAKEIRTGGFGTVHVGGRIDVESTAEGAGGDFHDMVQRADAIQKEGRPLSELDFKLLFFAWWQHKGYRLDPSKVRIPIELEEYFNDLATKHGIILDSWQKAWYTAKHFQIGPNKMFKEYPSYPDEAFQISVEGAYFKRQMSRMRVDGRITYVPHDETRSVNTFWDIGNDTTAIWWHQSDGVRHRLIDYYENADEGITHYVHEVRERGERFGYHYGKHFGPHDFGNTEWGNTQDKSRKDIAAGLGLKFTIVPRVGDKNDAIDVGRQFLSMCWIDDKHCGQGIRCLDNYSKKWNERMGMWSDEPLHNWASHGSDSLMTGAMGWMPERVKKPKKPAVVAPTPVTIGERGTGWMGR